MSCRVRLTRLARLPPVFQAATPYLDCEEGELDAVSTYLGNKDHGSRNRIATNSTSCALQPSNDQGCSVDSNGKINIEQIRVLGIVLVLGSILQANSFWGPRVTYHSISLAHMKGEAMSR